MVRHTVGGGRANASDEPRDHRDGDDVGEHVEDVRGDGHVIGLQVAREVDRQPEEHGCYDRTRGAPATEDHRGEGDVTESRGVARLELALGGHEGNATHTGDRATEHDVDVANPHDVDPDRRRGPWVLTYGAHVQPITRLEERETDGGDQHQHEVEEARLVEEDRSDDRNLRKQRDGEIRREGAGVELWERREDL